MKKVLIITYYWPPAGGPGVQRWLKFVMYLKNYDIEPIVYVPENPSYPITDKQLVNEIPNDIQIIKQPIFEPYKLAQLLTGKSSKTISKGIIPKNEKQSFIQKLLLSIRGNLFIPDARKYWVQPSVNYLKKVILEQKIDTIITTGPPHSLHLIGLKLKKQLPIRWLADFRDPWTSIGYHKKLKLTNYAKKKHKGLEQQVLNTADQLIVTSESTKKEFTQITNTPIEVITNGFEPVKTEYIQPDDKFTLVHIGSLLSERNPESLWLAISELINENNLFKQHFQLKFAGVVSDDILSSLKKFNINHYLNFLGYISHTEAIKLQRSAQVLLLIEIDSVDTQMIIPGKLFEYLASERPILSIGPKNADFAEIIRETKTGTFFNYEEKDQIKSQLLNYFSAYLNNSLKVIPKNIDRFTRNALTEKLAKLIKK